jgi:hypothetical protein
MVGTKPTCTFTNMRGTLPVLPPAVNESDSPVTQLTRPKAHAGDPTRLDLAGAIVTAARVSVTRA